MLLRGRRGALRRRRRALPAARGVAGWRGVAGCLPGGDASTADAIDDSTRQIDAVIDRCPLLRRLTIAALHVVAFPAVHRATPPVLLLTLVGRRAID